MAMGLSLLLIVVIFFVSVIAQHVLCSIDRGGTIAFASVGRANYAFDIFTLPVHGFPPASASHELKLTDGQSVNYNGQFVDPHSLLPFLSRLGISPPPPPFRAESIVYVSERDGRPELFLNLFLGSPESGDADGMLGSSPFLDKTAIPLREFSGLWRDDPRSFLSDRPSLISNATQVIFASTKEASRGPRQSWMAIYSANLQNGESARLSPPDVADYSPAVSPSGEWVLVASDEGRPWQGEVRELHTGIFVFKATDGSCRRRVVDRGGWPTWADDSTFFFHRQADDGWWSIYSGSLLSLQVKRLTPPGVHVFTPAAFPDGKRIAVATRRSDSGFRHIEIFDMETQSFLELTRRISPDSHHYNPFVSTDSSKVGYHRCRGSSALTIPRLESIKSPYPNLLAIVRVAGTFPSFSPDGSLVAYVPDLSTPGVHVMRSDGSGSRQVFPGYSFGTAWDWKRPGVIYTASGHGFTSELSTVHIVSIFNAHSVATDNNLPPLSYSILTKEGTGNNAFPSASPDGKHIVFRSGRSGYKNLYIMDALLGEQGGLMRLTEGPWTDTMCNWSPDGEWIAFASDRENPGGGSFALFFIHPDGTGLHKVLNSSDGGRVNHPFFSPDSKSIVFTTDYAGVSAEPISVPHQYQPYGEIFLARIETQLVDLIRLTHNSYEDGTPSWARIFIPSSLLSQEGEENACIFNDDQWLSSNETLLSPLSCGNVIGHPKSYQLW